ncbi:MAG TPA: molybdenum cofactor guanylyltransferase [Gemmatimonadales bacterium]|nr:molybdenum cofactor guanylyltransferase [Gemmatimonadales bacterium]
MRGAVLAGGAASRYGGRPKGLLEVGGRRILDRVAEAVAAVTGAPPLLVANAADASAWRPDLTTIPDARPGCGSVGGIYTAVAAAPGAVLCVAWDMPFVTEGLLRALVDGSADWDAFLPESDGRRGVEPLCAVYGPACRAAIERRLDAGDLKAVAFHADVRVGILPLDRVRRFGDPDELFFNVNTPADLERAEAVWRRRG